MALAALKGQQTLNELVSLYGVHPVQIAQWKQQATTGLPELFTGRPLAADVRLRRMDGRGRALDNVFVESASGGRRSVKYEEVYLKNYPTVPAAIEGLSGYFWFYNQERLHQALAYRTPATVYHNGVRLRRTG